MSNCWIEFIGKLITKIWIATDRLNEISPGESFKEQPVPSTITIKCAIYDFKITFQFAQRKYDALKSEGKKDFRFLNPRDFWLVLDPSWHTKNNVRPIFKNSFWRAYKQTSYVKNRAIFYKWNYIPQLNLSITLQQSEWYTVENTSLLVDIMWS